MVLPYLQSRVRMNDVKDDMQYLLWHHEVNSTLCMHWRNLMLFRILSLMSLSTVQQLELLNAVTWGRLSILKVMDRWINHSVINGGLWPVGTLVCSAINGDDWTNMGYQITDKSIIFYQTVLRNITPVTASFKPFCGWHPWYAVMHIISVHEVIMCQWNLYAVMFCEHCDVCGTRTNLWQRKYENSCLLEKWSLPDMLPLQPLLLLDKRSEEAVHHQVLPHLRRYI